MTERQARDGLHELQRAGLLVNVGSVKVGAHDAHLYASAVEHAESGSVADVERARHLRLVPTSDLLAA